MDNNKKYDVFVSYSRKDSDIVNHICKIMEQRQIRYYRDTTEIPGGSFFFEELADAITDSYVFLYIGSKNSYNSIYTPKEISFAIAEKKNIIIPFLIDEEPLPRNLRLAFSDLNVRNIEEHKIETIVDDIIDSVPRLKDISIIREEISEVSGLSYFPHYREALANYEFAERYFYDDRYEKYINMRMAVAANAKYSIMRGYKSRGEWLLSMVMDGDSELQEAFDDSFEKNEQTKTIKRETELVELRKSEIIKKIQEGIPIVNIEFADEIMDNPDGVVIVDGVSGINPAIKTKLITFRGGEIRMIHVDSGNFRMGASVQEGGDETDEQITHNVRLSSFYISEVQITQKIWSLVMNNNPSEGEGAHFPVYNISWYDCQQFINKLNEITGLKFRLPTESEWEYSARGGRYGKVNGFKYSGGNDLFEVLWSLENSGNQVHPVASKRPNELGLYDISGNLWEWCSDWYGEYPKEYLTNPIGPKTGDKRVCRGGSFANKGRDCRISKRESEFPDEKSTDIGFRLALSED